MITEQLNTLLEATIRLRISLRTLYTICKAGAIEVIRISLTKQQPKGQGEKYEYCHTLAIR